MSDQLQTAEINNKIVKAVSDYWDDHKHPMLLSSLGNAGGDPPIARLTREYAPTLLRYVQMHLADKVQVIHHASNPLVHSVAPANIPHHSIVSGATLQDYPLPPKRKRYLRAFWIAFTMPLDSNKRRYVKIQGSIFFKDLEDDIPELDSNQWLEITKDNIVSEPKEDQFVEEKIAGWIEKNELEINRFLVGSGSAKIMRGTNSLLSRLLTVLDPEERRRVTMPLDIVNKLLQRSR